MPDKCVCCDRSREEVGVQDLHLDPDGNLWCELCIESCIPDPRDKTGGWEQ